MSLQRPSITDYQIEELHLENVPSLHNISKLDDINMH